MRISTPKLLTSTILSGVLCAVAGTSAIARPLGEGSLNPNRPNTTEAEPVHPKHAEVVSRTSNFATIEMDNGERQTIPAARWKLNRLERGTDVWVAYGRIVAIESPDKHLKGNITADADYAIPMQGRVASITGNIASIELENGETVNVGISRIEQGQLVPGTQVTVDDGRIVDINPMSENPMEPNLRVVEYEIPMDGRVASITGNIASIELENGDTVNVGISRVQQGQLVPGTQVTVDNGQIIEIEPMSQ